MSKHIHAELMLQYAQDAMTTDEPWRLWEYRIPKEGFMWHSAHNDISFERVLEYRRKPETMKINGFDVPEPVREALSYGQDYFYTVPHASDYWIESTWDNHAADTVRLNKGLIHLTREAAELHAKALLSFTEVKP